MNVIIVGAKAKCLDSSCNEWNNVMQAKHSDLLTLKDIFSCDVKCYDCGYPYSKEADGIAYINEVFYLDGTGLSADKLNVIVEFTNMLDENFINHGEDNYQYHNLMKIDQTAAKLCVIACGCSWNNGFPMECISYVSNDGWYTPCDPYNVDNLLYVISCTQYIRSLSEEQKKVLYPYQLGLYQTTGTFMWRGSQANGYKSEKVLRQLFSLISATDCVLNDDKTLQKQDLEAFVSGNKHWNNMQWHLRKALSKFVYGM